MHMRPSPKANRCVSNSRSTSPQTAHPHPLALLTNMVQGIETISFPTNATGMAINRRSPRADRSSTRSSLQRDAASSSSSSSAGNRRFLPVTSAYLRYQTMHTFVVSQPMSAAILLLLVVAALDGFYESVRVRHPYNFAHGLSPASGLSKLPSSSLRRTATTGANGSELPTPLLAKHSTTATTAANDTASIPTAERAPPTTRVQSALEENSVSDNPSCLGKEHLVQILIAAGKTPEEAEAQCPTLPLWQEVVDLYGDAPIILGQERCQAYREAVRNQFEDAPPLHNIRVDGLFNVGTNALAQNNLLNLEHGRYFQPNLSLDDPDYAEKLGVLLFVGWGKHSMIKYKPTNARLQLPVVLVRDPYRWMKSMCKTPYRAVFDQQPNHCPNLVPTEDEQLASGNLTTYKVSVTQNAHSTVTDEFDSLADYWSEWNRMYRDVEFPRLIVRFEDTIFHAEAVMDAIARCAGVERAKPYRYYVEQAKSHGLSSNFVTALAKYGTSQGRFDGMTPADLAYARTHLDPALMNTFGYQYQGRYTAPQVSLAKES